MPLISTDDTTDEDDNTGRQGRVQNRGVEKGLFLAFRLPHAYSPDRRIICISHRLTGLKTAPKCPQDGLRSLQDGPRRIQSKTAQEASKTPQDASRRLQDGPRRLQDIKTHPAVGH